MNGATEAFVETAKRVINTAVGEKVLFTELHKRMFEAGKIVKQQPIESHLSAAEDGTYLCPIDLTSGRSSTHAQQGLFKERVTKKQIQPYSKALCKYFGKCDQEMYFLV